MKNIKYTQLATLSFSLLLGACTDGRAPRVVENQVINAVGITLDYKASLQYQDSAGPKNTDALQMAIKGGALYLTGRPFGFGRLEIAQDKEDPSVTFWASQTGLDKPPSDPNAFSKLGSWIVNSYATNALAIMGNVAFMSGADGTSVVSLADTGRPKETQRYPMPDPNTYLPVTDQAYVYAAMTPHPTKQIMYGFRKQDFVYTVDLSQGKLNLASKDAYGAPGESQCCAMGATTFQNKIFVAFRDRLVYWDAGITGRLENARESLQLNAVNVVSTARYLYVQHEPTAAKSAGSSRPSGIYVFDSNMRNLGYIKAGSPRRFAVSEDDTHFYANVDGQMIKVYEISWPY